MGSTAPVIVVGAGYTGRRLLRRLGDSALAGLSRTAADGVTAFDLDDDDPLALPAAIEAPYSIVYTVPPLGHRLQRLLELLRMPPERFVYLSTTGVYGDRHGKRVDESAPVAPESERARRRAEDEQATDEWCRQHGTGTTILRIPGIYGPERLGLARIREGVPVLREEDANPGNRIHVDDLVECCVAALEPETPAGIYNVGDGDERSSTWFALEVARLAGIEPPPTVSRAEAERTFDERRLSFLRESRTLDLTRMKKKLGVVAQYADATEGIRASLAASGIPFGGS